ncbi:MAG TPA: hypothetical protein VGO41_02535 [Steroidobacteraceae bacterium]|jgi:hypothetical protein|nr:hypothetical protein [Steroidobacteraceae bacterium]
MNQNKSRRISQTLFVALAFSSLAAAAPDCTRQQENVEELQSKLRDKHSNAAGEQLRKRMGVAENALYKCMKGR